MVTSKGAGYLLKVLEKFYRALLEKSWVISDRFSDSTLAYQGYGHGLDCISLDKFSKVVLGEFKPDLTIIFDLDPDVGLARARARGEAAPARRQGLPQRAAGARAALAIFTSSFRPSCKRPSRLSFVKVL